ncbi:DUF6635 family protein [Maritimibacter sp. DP1N21-5]|uniref:DUF6635 family protein n=1 Tax=Maritimibacter sp. DP1N21-5 TaxID=2836867 RepID=UPI001C48157D|nr:DUF6635 family protein [Maritimibacter sp. DP1N21-5]MBV7407685.1 hypothetical protein [Maritimibacter sp. DP1N21-5]
MDRHREIATFVREVFGVRGTLRLHRAAFGWDLLRAPANLLLAPVFLIVKLLAGLARLLRFPRHAVWLGSRRVILETAVARAVGDKVEAFLARQMPEADPAVVRRAVADYVGVRSAVAEITTMIVLVALGLVFFHAVTPGVISLAGPLAEARAYGQAVDRFPLGPWLGRGWYALFPVSLGFWQVAGTALVLAVGASLVTTFAGVIADPVQVATGTHRRRIGRLMARIARAEAGAGLAREHLAARAGDLSDLALTLWRSLR